MKKKKWIYRDLNRQDITEIAHYAQVSTGTVLRVLRGERDNPSVMTAIENKVAHKKNPADINDISKYLFDQEQKKLKQEAESHEKHLKQQASTKQVIDAIFKKNQA